MMQNPGDSEHGLSPGPQPLLETMLENEKRFQTDFGGGPDGGVTMFKLMIWIRDRIKRLLRHGTGRQA